MTCSRTRGVKSNLNPALSINIATTKEEKKKLFSVEFACNTTMLAWKIKILVTITPEDSVHMWVYGLGQLAISDSLGSPPLITASPLPAQGLRRAELFISVIAWPLFNIFNMYIYLWYYSNMCFICLGCSCRSREYNIYTFWLYVLKEIRIIF